MAVGDACRNFVSRHRCHPGAICADMEKGSNDLHGMYRNWVKYDASEWRMR